MKIIVGFSRIFVGILFIISGLIKLNDPIGFSYKLEEYFAENVLNIPFLIPYALVLAIFVVTLEVVLGILLLIGYKAKITVWSLLLLILFFTFLTFYSAYFNKVTDCGCFGDAIKLTPWESFIKDIVLLFFILILFFYKKYITPIFNPFVSSSITFISYTSCLFLAYYVLNHLPIKDFRAYKVGTNIIKGMQIPPGAPLPKYELTFIYKVNGVEKEFTQDDVMANKVPKDAVFVDRKDKLIEKGYVPPIHDFSMEMAGSDYKDELLQQPRLLIFVAYDLNKAKEEGLAILENLHQKALKKGYKVVALSASADTDISKVKEKHKHTFDYYFCDPTTLKTIERANPSLVVIQNGVIVDKKHFKDADKLNL